MNDPLEPVVDLVRERSGIALKAAQYASLRAAIRRVANDADEFVALARSGRLSEQTVARLLDEVGVKETTFLRDRAQLDAIDWRSLLEVARGVGDERVRVWSAACATGEEAYTLALLAAEAFGTLEPPVTVLGTDISATALEHASRGAYGRRALRTLPEPLRRRYFESSETAVVVGRELRRLVTFARHNLVSDRPSPSSFDLVVCRNVLIYFEPETAEAVVRRLETALRPGGVLVLGAADALCGAVRDPAAVPDRLPERRRRPGARVAPRRRFEDRLAAAVAAADAGRATEARAAVEALARERPLDAGVHYLRGVLELEHGAADAAATALSRALAIDPDFGLAAFKLGRANEVLGRVAAARRAYEHVLRTVGSDRHGPLLAQVDFGDVAAAARARLRVLG